MALHHLHHLVEFHDGDVEQGVFACLEEHVLQRDAFAHLQFGCHLGDFFLILYRLGTGSLRQGKGVEV